MNRIGRRTIIAKTRTGGNPPKAGYGRHESGTYVKFTQAGADLFAYQNNPRDWVAEPTAYTRQRVR